MKTTRQVSEGVINGEYTLRKWIELYQKGEFKSQWESEEAGWYDWWCSRTELPKKLDVLAPRVIAIAKSPLIDIDNTYVFFKNNQPCVGPRYDSFSICDIHTNEVLYWFGYIRKGCYGDSRRGWDVDAKINGSWGSLFNYASWTEIKKHFQI